MTHQCAPRAHITQMNGRAYECCFVLSVSSAPALASGCLHPATNCSDQCPPITDQGRCRVQTNPGRWAHGGFGHHLHDTGNDEIIRLSDRLNTMAEQLRTLLAQRHALATTEERQRLARELHDSVKQQVFAISMHLGAVALAVPTEAAQVRELLHNAQVMIQATHAELASLIFALQPAAVQARGLTQGLA